MQWKQQSAEAKTALEMINISKHTVTVSFLLDVECDDPSKIQSIVQEHQPYINATGNTHGNYTIKSKMRTMKVEKITN